MTGSKTTKAFVVLAAMLMLAVPLAVVANVSDADADGRVMAYDPANDVYLKWTNNTYLLINYGVVPETNVKIDLYRGEAPSNASSGILETGSGIAAVKDYKFNQLTSAEMGATDLKIYCSADDPWTVSVDMVFDGSGWKSVTLCCGTRGVGMGLFQVNSGVELTLKNVDLWRNGATESIIKTTKSNDGASLVLENVSVGHSGNYAGYNAIEMDTISILGSDETTSIYGGITGDDITLNGEVNITGITAIKGVSIEGTVGITCETVEDNKTVLGVTGITGNVTVKDGASLNGDVDVTGNITVAGVASLNGNVNATGGMIIKDDASLSGNVNVAGNVTVKDGASLNGDVNVAGDIAVDEGADVEFGENISLTGTFTYDKTDYEKGDAGLIVAKEVDAGPEDDDQEPVIFEPESGSDDNANDGPANDDPANDDPANDGPSDEGSDGAVYGFDGMTGFVGTGAIVTVTIGSETIDVHVGETIDLRADDPKDGYRFDGWYVDGRYLSDDDTLRITVIDEVNIQQVWTAIDSVAGDGTGVSTEAGVGGVDMGMGGLMKSLGIILLILGGLYVVKRELA